MINPLLITKVGQIVYWSFKIKNDSLVVNKDVTVALTVPSDFVYVDANQPIVTRGSVIGTNWVITSGTQTMLPGVHMSLMQQLMVLTMIIFLLLS